MFDIEIVDLEIFCIFVNIKLGETMRAKTTVLRERVQSYVNTADDRLLRLIEALAVSYQEGDKSEQELNDIHKKELDRRLQRYINGKMVFYSREEIDEKLNQMG